MITWPDSPEISHAVRFKLNSRIAQFLQEDTSDDGAKDGHAIQNLVLDLIAIYSETEGKLNEGASQLSTIVSGLEWDTEEPKFAHIQKYINRLFSGRLLEAHEYIDKAISQRLADDAEIARGAIRETGAKGGNEKNRLHKEAIKNAMAFYQDNHSKFKTKKAAAYECAVRFPPVKMSTYYRILRKV